MRIEFHSDKLSLEEYLSRIARKSGSKVFLDESGDLIDSIGFSQCVKEWTVAVQDTHLVVGPAEGWQQKTPHAFGTKPLIVQTNLAS